MTLKQALWEIVRDENIIITNQNIDWLLDRASKKATGDAQALKESILERKRVIEENIPCALTNEEKVSEKLLINENKSNNSDFKSNKSQCIDCIHNDICQFYKALYANVICYPCGFYEAKSNEELFKQALVEGLNRRFDKTIEEAKKIEQIEEMAECCPYFWNGACTVDAANPTDCDLMCEMFGFMTSLANAGYRKQSEGEWIDRYKGKYANSLYVCSICDGKSLLANHMNELLTPTVKQILTPYCPHCGAKMKGGAG